MGTRTRESVEVQDGTVLTFDVLRWDAGWDFDCPICVLRPVVRFSPNGDDAYGLVESMCLDASIDHRIDGEWTDGELVDRQYPLKSLKRRWSIARAGWKFPVRRYAAYRIRARFFQAPDDPTMLAFELDDVEGTADGE